MNDRIRLHSKLPRPQGGIGKNTFNERIIFSVQYIARHLGYNVFSHIDNSDLVDYRKKENQEITEETEAKTSFWDKLKKRLSSIL